MPALPVCAAVCFRARALASWDRKLRASSDHLPPTSTTWHGHDAPRAQGRFSPSFGELVSAQHHLHRQHCEWGCPLCGGHTPEGAPVGNHLQPPTVSCVGQHHVNVAQDDTDPGCHTLQGPPTSAKHPGLRTRCTVVTTGVNQVGGHTGRKEEAVEGGATKRMRKKWGGSKHDQTSGARGEGKSRPWPALGPQGCLGTVWQPVQQCSFEIFLDRGRSLHVASLVARCLARRCLVPVGGGLAPNKTDLQDFEGS